MGRILIAEDDPQASEMLARICAFRGHEVAEARDALQAVGMFESFEPDLVISDLAMPLGGGQHLIRSMRKTEAGRTCPVIIITGYAPALSDAERAALAPCAVLPKPLELEPMLQALDAGFADARARREATRAAAPAAQATTPSGEP